MKLVQLYSLNERVWLPLFDAALGMRVSNPRYRKDAEISEFTAGRDLKKLCEVELLVPEGERKMRTYGPSKMLIDARRLIRLKKVVDDPYELIQRRPRRAIVGDAAQPQLPGL